MEIYRRSTLVGDRVSTQTPTDRWGGPLATSPEAARCFNDALHLRLMGQGGARPLLEEAVDTDPRFARAHLLLGDEHFAAGNNAQGLRHVTRAVRAAQRGDAWIAGHVDAYVALMTETPAAARARAEQRLRAHPEDGVVLRGLDYLLFWAGGPNKSADALAWYERLAPTYKADAWFAGYHAFALQENLRFVEAEALARQALEEAPNYTQGAHALAHALHHRGEAGAGRDFVESWLEAFGPVDMQGHLRWHTALFSHDLGEHHRALHILEAEVLPQKRSGPPMLKLADGVGILWRERVLGRNEQRHWEALRPLAHRLTKAGILPPDTRAAALATSVGAWTQRLFTGPGLILRFLATQLRPPLRPHLGAIDGLLVIATDDGDARAELRTRFAGTPVEAIATGVIAFAGGDDEAAAAALASEVEGGCEVLGGSRAERDLIVELYIAACLRSGRHLPAARTYVEERRRHEGRGRMCLLAAQLAAADGDGAGAAAHLSAATAAFAGADEDAPERAILESLRGTAPAAGQS